VGCRNDARMGDPGRHWLDGSEASVRRRAVRREPTETNTFEVNENNTDVPESCHLPLAGVRENAGRTFRRSETRQSAG
jgi:hypothetical protein